MKKNLDERRMRVSFDLDGTLFVSPSTHKTEPELKFPLNKIFKERLRAGTRDLINKLQELGFEVWIYTSSYRSEKYIKGLFWLYGVHLDGIVNAERHLREVQRGRKEMFPQKVPSRYHISLHIDDEEIICSQGRHFGYESYRLDEPDDEWGKKIIELAGKVRDKMARQGICR